MLPGPSGGHRGQKALGVRLGGGFLERRILPSHPHSFLPMGQVEEAWAGLDVQIVQLGPQASVVEP